MTKKEFIGAVQRRTVRAPIGASTARGPGNPGAVKAAREFLARLRLTDFAVANPEKGLFTERQRSAQTYP
jgi:hypothetical protein